MDSVNNSVCSVVLDFKKACLNTAFVGSKDENPEETEVEDEEEEEADNDDEVELDEVDNKDGEVVESIEGSLKLSLFFK